MYVCVCVCVCVKINKHPNFNFLLLPALCLCLKSFLRNKHGKIITRNKIYRKKLSSNNIHFYH